jgi:hypothetical protein
MDRGESWTEAQLTEVLPIIPVDCPVRRLLSGPCYDQFFAGHVENKQAFKEGMYDPYRNGSVRSIDGLTVRGFDRRLLKTMGTDEREQYLDARVYIRPGNQAFLELPIEVKPRSTNDGPEHSPAPT